MTQPIKIPLSRTVPTEPGVYLCESVPKTEVIKIRLTRRYGQLHLGSYLFSAHVRDFPNALYFGPIEFTTEQES
jgi:hypothetical protein